MPTTLILNLSLWGQEAAEHFEKGLNCTLCNLENIDTNYLTVDVVKVGLFFCFCLR